MDANVNLHRGISWILLQLHQIQLRNLKLLKFSKGKKVTKSIAFVHLFVFK